MDHLHFIFAIFFMLLGPIKILPVFVKLTKDREPAYARKAAIQATVFAFIICLFLMLTSSRTLARYHIHPESLKIAGGLVLLISALRTIFPPPHQDEPAVQSDSPLAIALSPLATPVIVTPAGVAAVMIFVSVAPHEPGMFRAIRIALIAILALDFLTMYFAKAIMRVPLIFPAIRLFGAVMLVVQVAGAVDLIVVALKSLGLFHV